MLKVASIRSDSVTAHPDGTLSFHGNVRVEFTPSERPANVILDHVPAPAIAPEDLGREVPALEGEPEGDPRPEGDDKDFLAEFEVEDLEGFDPADLPVGFDLDDLLAEVGVDMDVDPPREVPVGEGWYEEADRLLRADVAFQRDMLLEQGYAPDNFPAWWMDA